MTVQIVEIAGQKMAMLPVAEFERLVDLVEDKRDLAAAGEAETRRLDGEEYLPASVVDRIIAGDNALRVWRKYRGLTQAGLGKLAEVRAGFVSKLESGKGSASMKTWRALAKSLRVSLEDINPSI